MSAPQRAHEPEAPTPAVPAHDVPPDDLTLDDLVQRAREQAEAEAAVAAVMRREGEKAAKLQAMENRKHHSTPVRLVLLVSLMALNAYLWLSDPEWMRYKQPDAPSVDYYQGSWKIAVYLQRQRIEEYRIEKGRVPQTAQQAGPPVHGVQYTPIAEKDYQLAAGSGPRAIVYHSTDSLAVLMGRTLVQMGLVTGGIR